MSVLAALASAKAPDRKYLFDAPFAPTARNLALGRLAPFLEKAASEDQAGKKMHWPAHMAISLRDDMLIRSPLTRHLTITPWDADQTTPYAPKDLLPLFDEVFQGKNSEETKTLRKELQKWIEMFEGKDRGQIIAREPEYAVTINQWVGVYCRTIREPNFDYDSKQLSFKSLIACLEKVLPNSELRCGDIQAYISIHCEALSSLQQNKVFETYGACTAHLFTEIVELLEKERRKFILNSQTQVTAALAAATRVLRSEWGLRNEKGALFPLQDAQDNPYEESLRSTYSIAYQIRLVEDHLVDKVMPRFSRAAFEEILAKHFPDPKVRENKVKDLAKDFFDKNNLPTRPFAIFILENLGFLTRFAKEDCAPFEHLHRAPSVERTVLPSKNYRALIPMTPPMPFAFVPEQIGAYAIGVVHKLLRPAEHARFIELLTGQGILAPLSIQLLEKINDNILSIDEILAMIASPGVVASDVINYQEALNQSDYASWLLIKLVETPLAGRALAITQYVHNFPEAKENLVKQFQEMKKNLESFFQSALEKGRAPTPQMIVKSRIGELDFLAKIMGDIMLALDVENIPDGIAKELGERLNWVFERQKKLLDELAAPPAAAAAPAAPELMGPPDPRSAKRQKT